MSKPSLPQGTRDFNAATVQKRQYIFQTIRTVFELFGFQPLETPAMEQLETLMGKYGEEGDKLIFKILNNGLDNPQKAAATTEGFQKILDGKSSTQITERALRYDLTIPFARYVAMHHGALSFPFKRYQIQPVWRADRPQKGRYREFYQCDADIVGSDSLLNEVELTAIYLNVFKALQLDVEVKMNNRKILLGLAQVCGGEDKMIDLTIAIDKLDKIGIEKVQEELQAKGLTSEQVNLIKEYLQLNGNAEQLLQGIEQLLGTQPETSQGLKELHTVITTLEQQGVSIQLDPTLARGLNYYTGIIFEMKAPASVNIGSIGGGGRYDNLTGLFGVPNVPGVGISFGVDRIYDVLEELNLFPTALQSGTRVLFFNLGTQEAAAAFDQMQLLRQQGIACELFPENVKFDKQFKYAEKKKIQYVVIIGEKELQEKTATIKNLATGNQLTVPFKALRQEIIIS
mgnify:CR=1 FL=1